METPAIPGPEELASLVEAICQNAADLLSDARLLFDQARYPRAHALATLAYEEIGKAGLCLEPLIPGSPTVTPRAFWGRWARHSDKLAASYTYAALFLQPDLDTLDRDKALTDLKDMSNAKLRGLYVDYVEGFIELPSQVQSLEAEHMISSVAAILDHFSQFAVDQLAVLASPAGQRAMLWLLDTHRDKLLSSTESIEGVLRLARAAGMNDEQGMARALGLGSWDQLLADMPHELETPVRSHQADE